ncbi:YPL245W [Saccharomyces arboricola H-6]|uniref:YPL245W n=1 Tax=Saccharomyces arboricola (strain H-6 / AS 2.3317 / CBS 10644) TaxID=1160507 RepID=J8PYI3_SACAR|nr:YPL245W [Saccharomyces arboricola H-6]
MHGPTPKAISRNVRSVKRPRRAPRPVVSTQAMNKLSHVALSAEQKKLRERVLSFVRSNLSQYKPDWKHPAMFVIQGDAGTGKSVILNSLFNEIQKLSQFPPSSEDILHGTRNYLVVNHPEMLKLYIRISDSFKYIAKSSLERPTSLINNLQKKNVMADVVIVDEAHLLATSKDAFKRFYGENHLKDLMSLCKVLILVYDDKQALRMGSYWDEDSNNGATLKDFYNEIPPQTRDWYTLKQQFRVAAPQNVLNWIDQISVAGKIPSIESILPKGDASSVDDKTKDFDFKIWDDCGAMYKAIKEKDQEYGQCRMLSTYDFPYRLDGNDYYVECGDSFKVRWDRYTPREVTPWSERGDTIDEVGSVYTVQGFDLNYAGVILGRSIGYDAANDCIKLRPELYDDRAGFTKKKNIHNADNVKQKIIMNSVNVLLTRGVRGLYVYAYDPELRERLLRSSKK